MIYIYKKELTLGKQTPNINTAPQQPTNQRNKMKTAKFVFDGIEGYVNKNGFMQWATFSCDMQCAVGELKLIVEKAYKTL